MIDASLRRFVQYHRFRFPRERRRCSAGQAIDLAVRRDAYVHRGDCRRGRNLVRHSREILRCVHLIRPHRYRSELTIDIREGGIERSERGREMGMGVAHFDVLLSLLLMAPLDVLTIGHLKMLLVLLVSHIEVLLIELLLLVLRMMLNVVVGVGGRGRSVDPLSERDEEVVQRLYLCARVVGS